MSQRDLHSLSGYLDNPDGSIGLGLTTETDMVTVVKAMASSDSGLDVRDRMWLKITIPKAFIGMYMPYCKRMSCNFK